MDHHIVQDRRFEEVDHLWVTKRDLLEAEITHPSHHHIQGFNNNPSTLYNIQGCKL